MLNENVMEVLEEYLQPWASIKGGFVPGSKISPNGAVGDKPKNPTNVYVIYEVCEDVAAASSCEVYLRSCLLLLTLPSGPLGSACRCRAN